MNERENALQQAWCEVLGIENAAVGQNFFDLGGDSLLAIELFTQVESECGWELPIDVLLASGSYAEIVATARA